MNSIRTQGLALSCSLVSLLAIAGLGASALVFSAQSGPIAPGDIQILHKTPLDKAVDFPRQTLATYFDKMGKEKTGLIRLVEGGVYNVNIRHVDGASPATWRPEFHKDTVDVWIIQEGTGTVVTGGQMIDGKVVGGVERQVGPGDLVFIPAGIYHGVKETMSITWLNVRFPDNRAGASPTRTGD